MAISSSHWDLLRQAVKRLQPTAFAKYFTLQSLLRSTRTSDRKEFQKQFTIHYRLNTGGLTEAFKERYFELLFSCKPCGQTDPYTSLLLELYRFPRRKGDLALQASFVSKLVAIHDESRPIFDIHVSNFFGMSVPKVGNVEFRIAGFVANLERISKRSMKAGRQIRAFRRY